MTPTHDEDGLLGKLRELPSHEPSAAPGQDPRRAARAAFEERTPAHGGLGERARTLALASVVGLYLSWAFSAAIALNR